MLGTSLDLSGSPQQEVYCEKIEDSILALMTRSHSLSINLDYSIMDVYRLFPRLRGCNTKSSWLPEGYTEALIGSREKFPAASIPFLIPGLQRKCVGPGVWVDEPETLYRATVANCCLVSREFNRIFTPVLYNHILLDGQETPLTSSLLLRTFQDKKRSHMVYRMTIGLKADGSNASLLSLCFGMPNLCQLALRIDIPCLSTLHPNVAQYLRTLSRNCVIRVLGCCENSIRTNWELLPSWLSFIQCSKLDLCHFLLESLDGG